MSDVEEPSFQVPNLERGLRILEYLVGCEQEESISTLSRELGYPVNSVMRILNALEHYGYVERNPDTKGYILTHKMLCMGRRQVHTKGLVELSQDVMRTLRDQIGETVVLSVLDHGEGLILEQVQGLHPFRFVCEPGTRQCLHASASTKAILAFSAAEEIKAILDNVTFLPMTPATLVSKEAFLRELDAVRSCGYAVDRAEALEGVHCIGGAVRDRDGVPVASITVTGPASRLPLSGMEQFGRQVREACETVSRRQGYLADL